MFDLAYSSPCPIQGTIRVAKPIMRPGPLTDLDGRHWNVWGIIGKVVIAVRESELHPYYTDTTNHTYGIVQQRWQPYKVKIVEEQEA